MGRKKRCRTATLVRPRKEAESLMQEFGDADSKVSAMAAEFATVTRNGMVFARLERAGLSLSDPERRRQADLEKRGENETYKCLRNSSTSHRFLHGNSWRWGNCPPGGLTAERC
jgi:hypothetical protein